MAKKQQTFFTKEQLKQQILSVGEYEHKVFMPNEIFSELKGFTNDNGEYIEGFYDIKGYKVKGFTSSTHLAYAYTYLYLAHYMYRYCKYYYIVNDGIYKEINEKIIKNVLGFPSNSDQYTYITKKNGVLDKLGLIRKAKDKPTECILVEHEYNNGKKIWEVDHFVMESGYPEIYGNSRNRKINYPVKAFFRGDWAEEEGCQNGTFFEYHNTHMIDIDVFIYCMTDKDLGVEGFYLYCYLLYENNKYKLGFTCPIKKLVTSTGLSIEILKKQLKNLERRNMITNNHMPFCIDRPEDKITKANTYSVNDVREFAKSFMGWNVIPKQRMMDAEQYEAEVGFVNTCESESNFEYEDFTSNISTIEVFKVD